MWIYRDKDGSLWVSTSKPNMIVDGMYWSSKPGYMALPLNKDSFFAITYGDGPIHHVLTEA